MKLTPIQTLALDFLSALDKREKQYAAVNKILRDFRGDFSHEFFPMDFSTYTLVFKMLDEILGEENASYYFYECRNMKNGGSITVDGKTWKIRNLKDLKKYIENAQHSRSCH